MNHLIRDLGKERYAELRREAEANRLANQTTENQPGLRERLLVIFADFIMSCGLKLKERFTEVRFHKEL